MQPSLTSNNPGSIIRHVNAPLDLAGQIFGRLTARRRVLRGRKGFWFCDCSCGLTAVVEVSKLRSGHTKSCGCLVLRHGHSDRQGGERNGARSPEYHSWIAMKDRCTNPSHRNFSNYGGRGVTICERWLSSFENFLADMGPRPSPSHSLDRYPNRDGHYEPGNCRWATDIDQARNRRTNRILVVDGRSMPIIAWAELSGLGYSTICERIRRGWPAERAVREPVHR